MAKPLPSSNPCPVCGGKPEIGICEPWPRGLGPAAWYAVCYRMTPVEHCVGVNGGNQRNVLEEWNAETDK